MRNDLEKEHVDKTRPFRDLVIISVIAVLVFAIAHVFNLFEIIAEFSRRYEEWNIDEFIIVLAILGFAFAIFSLRRWRELRQEMIERNQAEKEIKKLYEDLEHRTIELEATNKELEALSYSVSHDLRTPLIVIGAFSRKLLGEHLACLNLKGRHYLDIIQTSAEKTCQLIDDLLGFFRSGHLKLEPSGINMEELARGQFEELRGIVPTRTLQLETKPIPHADGDRAMIRQVFINLLSNAIKFTRGKKIGVIEIGGWSEDHQNIYYVKDNGVGFDMEQENQLFRAFQRLHHQEDYEGTGVGLALVQQIIHRHGGRVWAEGKVNKGATFYFSLPNTRKCEGKKLCT
jgi:signal transduction histidine kinase